MILSQCTAWIAKPHPKILASSWRHHPSNNTILSASLQVLIPQLVNAPDALISTPAAVPVEQSTDHLPGPYHLLILGISPEAARLLLELETLVMAGAMFFFVPFKTRNCEYIGTIEGLGVQDGQ